jgi:hypothetical protein
MVNPRRTPVNCRPDPSTVAAVRYLAAEYRAHGLPEAEIRRRILEELGKTLIARADDEHARETISAELQRTVDAAIGRAR